MRRRGQRPGRLSSRSSTSLAPSGAPFGTRGPGVRYIIIFIFLMINARFISRVVDGRPLCSRCMFASNWPVDGEGGLTVANMCVPCPVPHAWRECRKEPMSVWATGPVWAQIGLPYQRTCFSHGVCCSMKLGPPAAHGSASDRTLHAPAQVCRLRRVDGSPRPGGEGRPLPRHREALLSPVSHGRCGVPCLWAHWLRSLLAGSGFGALLQSAAFREPRASLFVPLSLLLAGFLELSYCKL